jgi:hypothetical protein
MPSASAGSNKPKLASAQSQREQTVTSRSMMPTEQLSYAQMAERLSVFTEAARALVKRHRLPRSRSNDGKTLVAVDLASCTTDPCPA